MNIFIFILGCSVFIILGFFVIYWSFIKAESNEYYIKEFLCILCMAMLTLFLSIFGKHLESFDTLKWIVSSASIVTILIILIIIFKSKNNFISRLLLLILPLVLSIYTLVSSFLINDGILFDSKSTKNIYIILIASIIPIYIELVLIKSKNSLYNSKNNFHSKNMVSKNQYSLNISHYGKNNFVDIERVISKIYLLSQEKFVSPSSVKKILDNSKINAEISHLIMQRLFNDDLYKRCSVLSLIEFSQELLPEIFNYRKTYRSSSFDIRYYEDFYEKLRFSLQNDNRKDLSELNKKLDYIVASYEDIINLENKHDKQEDNLECKNQIRELFHALEMPIATAEMATDSLKISFTDLTIFQSKKLGIIQNNLKLIKSILFAYRELTFMNIYSSSNTFFSLPTIINSVKDMLYDDNENISLDLNNIPENIEKYSTNLVVVLLLPLLQNALEATPSNKKVIVNYIENEKNHHISIENWCKHTPSQLNLDTEGYSSKDNNHTGTGISIVRRISQSVGVIFKLTVKNNKVVATLDMPRL